MASSSLTCCNFHSSILLPTSPTRFSLSFSHPLLFAYNYNGIPLRSANSSSRVCAKFEKFQGEPSQEADASSLLEITEIPIENNEEDDSCLPPDLEGAVLQSSEAAATFVSSGGMRATVELLIPQLQFLDDEGAQVELWELSRIFLDTLIKETKYQGHKDPQRDGCAIITDLSTHDTSIHRVDAHVLDINFPALLSSMAAVLHDESMRVKAIFPDAGAAALLKYRWKDALFSFASLSDRKPVASDDEMVVMVVPDYQMLEYVERIASTLSDDPPRPLIMWNPRLISEDVGVGYNVRRLRSYFLSTFTTVYYMRPMPFGAVFRCYPGKWKVFSDDKDRPNRYLLAKEYVNRPDAEDIEILFDNEEEKSDQGESLLDKAAGILSSINRFMKAMR